MDLWLSQVAAGGSAIVQAAARQDVVLERLLAEDVQSFLYSASASTIGARVGPSAAITHPPAEYAALARVPADCQRFLSE